jgi:hypothetical protein
MKQKLLIETREPFRRDVETERYLVNYFVDRLGIAAEDVVLVPAYCHAHVVNVPSGPDAQTLEEQEAAAKKIAEVFGGEIVEKAPEGDAPAPTE